ncbi:uncharacterized protein TNCV_2131451 [Trichonephila clavipes]|nr:uncharacterized protein TNCV_2131451 [Trichonephila clavipes]
MLQNGALNKDWNNPGKFPGLQASKAAVLNISAWSGSLKRAMDPPICEPEIAYRISKLILTSHCSATRGLLATDHVILNHGQVTWTTPELAPPLLTTTQHQREDVSALDRFNVHRFPTRRVFSGTGIELMTCLPWLDTLTTGLLVNTLKASLWPQGILVVMVWNSWRACHEFEHRTAENPPCRGGASSGVVHVT